MKRNSKFAFVLFAAIALWLPAGAMADTAFNLDINKRAPNRPVGRVKLTLELAAAPTAGVTSVSIGGGAAVPMPAAGTTPGTTAAGDFFTFGKGTGNSVVIDYNARSSFAAPSNLCVLKAGANCDVNGDGVSNEICDGNQVRPINFIGPTVSAYRLNAYTSASDFTCGSAFKRVESAAAPDPFAATITLGGATDKGRHPLDVMLVLDRSGSMDSPAPGAPPASASKWEILRDSITSLVNRWVILDAPLGGAEWSGDRINMVLFETAASNATSPIFELRADWADVIAGLPANTGNTTALGPGINLGVSNWNTVVGAKNDPVMVIMTDGIQNVNPEVTPDFKLSPILADPAVALTSYGMPMHTIAFGTPATTEAELLDGIAQQTAGLSRMTADAFGTSNAFADALVDALKGDTISLAHRERGTLPSGSRIGPLIPFVVDQSVLRAVFSVEWSAPFTNALELHVFPPGMTPSETSQGAVPTMRRDAVHSTVLGFDIGAHPIGTWQVRVARRDTATGGVARGDIPFNLSSHFVDSRLSYTTAFDTIRQGTGDRMNVRAEIAYDGLPLAGLPGNAVTVRIHRPGESIGNILHDTQVPDDVLNGPAGPDPTTAYQRKVDHLTDNAELADQVAPVNAATISLVETADGVYTGSFADTSEAGLYTFDVVLDWTTAQTGRVHRAERLERDVRVKPDKASTQITTTDMTGGVWQVRVTPRDRFDNYVGPGHGHFVTGTLNGPGTLAAGAPADRNQTGDYVFTISDVPAGVTPDLTVKYDGVPVGSTTGGAGGPGTGGGSWRFFVDGGINSPDSGLDSSFSVNAGIERIITSNLSIEGILGYHAFDGFVVDPDALQLSANAKYFFGTGPLRPFVNGGVGVYRIDPPDDTSFGWNVGGGVLYELNSKWGVEGVFNRHDTDLVDWWTLQAGLRWSF
jgi:hypothetical protein